MVLKGIPKEENLKVRWSKKGSLGGEAKNPQELGGEASVVARR